MDLVTWLRAQLDTDEAHARKDLWCLDRATATPWRAWHGYNLPYSYLATDDKTEIVRLTTTDGPQYHADGTLIDGYEDRHSRDTMLVARLVNAARARAERALAEVEAKRRILELHDIQRDDSEFEGERSLIIWCASCNEPGWCPTLRLLALPYADREGFQEDWVIT
jgi:hypothetical protein